MVSGFKWSDDYRAQDKAVFEKARKEGIDAGKSAWLDHPLFASVMRNELAAASMGGMVADWSGWQFIHKDPAQKLDPPATERLNAIDVPTLVIVGQEDNADFQAVSDLLVKDIPKARKEVIDGAGHLPPLENPREFNEAVLGFLTAL